MVAYQQIFKKFFDAKRQGCTDLRTLGVNRVLVNSAQQLTQNDSVIVISFVIIMGQSDIRDIEQWLQKISLEHLIWKYGTFSESFSF